MGTSPRTRGKLRYATSARHERRNIPAHAGKTTIAPFFESAFEGTSPRTRGKLRTLGLGRGAFRNIPAHAGKTIIFRVVPAVNEEHPRARGENASPMWPEVIRMGTSPRTWGKRERNKMFLPDTGNIPAHAGKTTSEFTVVKSEEEHPRARGENCENSKTPRPGRGTSPRTRGKPPHSALTLRYSRNIPAHAGKTLCSKTSGSKKAEHPRARGENGNTDRSAGMRSGTSPRTRGKRITPQSTEWRIRNIPAHAGKTS